jgi:putative restriction endonuclease
MDDYDLLIYLTKKDLLEANAAASREKRNRILPKKLLDELPDDINCLVSRFFYHSKNEVRLFILIDGKENFVFLDVSLLRFNSLPTAKRFADRRVEFCSDEEAESRRPYPNRREWQETIVRKPVRQQDLFRRLVLEAYENQCAVCCINNPKLLRAAHIVPVVDGGDDSISNGICLCVNHEIAFDAGILTITSEREVLVSAEDDLGVKYFKIRLPSKKEDYPASSNLSEKLALMNISN